MCIYRIHRVYRVSVSLLIDGEAYGLLTVYSLYGLLWGESIYNLRHVT